MTFLESQQEPRLLSHYSADANMVNAYTEGKDLYAMIASKVYNNNYADNLEFHPDTGKIQPDGKKRRTACKSLLLGIMYGMGVGAIAAKLKCSIEEAQDIKQSFFKQFPNVENWILETEKFAHKYGYVEDIWGRRRRLPDILMPKFEVITGEKEFNPLLGSKGKFSSSAEKLKQQYMSKLKNCRDKKSIDSVKLQAKQAGIEIKDNTGYVSRSERQCVNARIQGGAASMSKRAMINVYRNEELRNLGFRLLLTVHDELIGECPKENKERCKELLSQCMIDAAKPEVIVPFKCDASDFDSWYIDVYASEILKEYRACKDFEKLCKNHPECTSEQLQKMIE